jgi:hypothetical protein
MDACKYGLVFRTRDTSVSTTCRGFRASQAALVTAILASTIRTVENGGKLIFSSSINLEYVDTWWRQRSRIKHCCNIQLGNVMKPATS